MWRPNQTHPIGEIGYTEYNDIITEIELGIDFGVIQVSSADLGTEFDTIEAKTIHTQMQIALIEIGNALNFQTWIAKNDRSIPVRGTTLGQLPGVIQSLDDVPSFFTPEMKEAAALIDCIWVADNGKRISAIIEIEHSTGVTSGMTRMSKLHKVMYSLQAPFTVVAPNHLRNKVVTEANTSLFKAINTRYMPYSTVRELYGLIQRYTLKGVVDHNFVEPFMEKVVTP